MEGAEQRLIAELNSSACREHLRKIVNEKIKSERHRLWLTEANVQDSGVASQSQLYKISQGPILKFDHPAWDQFCNDIESVSSF